MPSLINDAITQSIMRIGEKPIAFVLDITEDLPSRLCGDDLRLKQVLNNLLSNAFKYTREGTVELGVRCERYNEQELWMTAWVSDTGPGIKSEHLGSLFSDYAMIDAQSNRKIEGTGLGLPITKKVVELMSGSISVESEYGKGSTFTIKILQHYAGDAVIGPAVVNSMKNFRYSDQKRRQNSHLMRVSLPYAKVLVVDDVATNLDVARGMLKPYGMQIDCASSGEEAIDAIRGERVRYNAIFMDHMMPGMDGIEATRIIREEIGTEYATTVPIIALTANAIVGNEDMFLSKGFQAFISKPIEIDRLDAVIREWVRDKELEKELGQINVDGTIILNTRSGDDRRKPSNRRSGYDRRDFQKITGLNFSKGMKQFSGDEKSYLNILRSYAANTQPLLEKAKAVSRENLDDYAIAVHGIKGSSQGICAEAIGEQAAALEAAAKEGNVDFVMANNAAFIEAAEKLISELDAILHTGAPTNLKPEKDKPDDELLGRIHQACEAGDIDAVDLVIAELGAFDYTSDDGLAVWLRENADQMNYVEMARRLGNGEQGTGNRG